MTPEQIKLVEQQIQSDQPLREYFAALKADAARWAWYANQIEMQDMDALEAAFGTLNKSDEKVTKAELDAAIDAAIAGEKK